MPNDLENRVENALAPIRAKLLFIAASLDVGKYDSVKAPDPMIAANLLRDVERQIGADIVEPLYQNGAEPETGEGLDLDEVEVRELIADLYRLSAAAAYAENEQCEERELRNCLIAINLKVPRIVADIERSAGMELSGREWDAIYDEVKPWGERARSVGRDAVEEVGS